MSKKEYRRIAETIIKKAPCNLLAFGTGRDSKLYLKPNRDGYTLFIEDQTQWIEHAMDANPSINICQATYTTKQRHAHKYLKNRELIPDLDLLEDISNTHWDVIILDAPCGYALHCPSRVQSIKAPAKLAPIGCDIFIHDCERFVEKAFSDAFFKKSDLRDSYHRTRHYHIRGS